MKYRNVKLLTIGMILALLFTTIGALTSAQGAEPGAGPLGIIVRPPDETGLSIRVWEDRGVYAVGETIRIHFEVNQDAFVYIYNIDATGTVRLIFPNPFAPDNFVRAGRHTIPDGTYKLEIVPPPGTNYIQAIASPVPLDIVPKLTIEIPFPILGTDPAAFKAKLLVRLQGIAPTPVWAEDWLSFQIVVSAPPTQGLLTIDSTPSFARIYIDGRYYGWTPRTIHLPPGSYHLRIIKSGYYDWVQHVSVRARHTRMINAVLLPLTVNERPVAVFTLTPPRPDVARWMRFDASDSFDPDGTIISYEWDFGDGTRRTGRRPFHRYTTGGLFWVTLTVTDNDGATATKTMEVIVGPVMPPNQPPVAIFTFTPPTPIAGEWIRFDATSSHDPDGTIISYKWDFGDGTRRIAPAVVNHRYTVSRVYRVTLTVTDSDGATATKTMEIVVRPVMPPNQPPVAIFTFTPPTPMAGEWIRFDAAASHDPDGTIISYEWDFGDGTRRTGRRPFHRYTTGGLFWVTLTVTDNDGATATKTIKVIVGPIELPNQPPVAIFTFTPPTPIAGEWIRFDATSSHDPDGTIISYKWDFGDGTRRIAPAVVNHRYTVSRAYRVTLTVTDSDGATATKTMKVIVRPFMPPIGKPPVAMFTAIPPTPMIGEAIRLDATSSFDPDGWIVTYRWDRDGDGIYDAGGPIVSARYWIPGWQTIRLTVIDNIGLSATTTERIWVGPAVGIPSAPPMAGIPGIFVWGTDRWNVTINAGTDWVTPRRYRIELRTDGAFHNVDRAAPPGVAPLGIVPAPIDGGKTLIFEGNLITGSLNYSFTVPNSESIWMRLQLDIDGDGTLDESSRFIYLGPRMVRPPHTPFVVGLPDDHPGPLVPTLNFRIGTAITYTAVMRFIIWITTIRALGG